MAILRVGGDPRATDDVYSLSQFADDRYTSWHSCIVNGVRFRCKERDDNFKTQCSGVCTWGDDENGDMAYYGVLLEILELDFICQRKVFMFRCKWYNTDPKGKRIVVDNNVTSIDITSDWYAEEPFILATQAQQVFYLNNQARGRNWMAVQRVNHRNIYDIAEQDDEDSMNEDVFQEEDSYDLPSFHPTEEVDDTSLLVREDVEPATLPHEVVFQLRNEGTSFNDRGENSYDIEDYEDDGRIFCDDEASLGSETDDNSDDLDVHNYDDDDDIA